jgi:hypothetical protein
LLSSRGNFGGCRDPSASTSHAHPLRCCCLHTHAQDDDKALHKCQQEERKFDRLSGTLADEQRPTGFCSSITVGSMLPFKTAIMKGSIVELLARRWVVGLVALLGGAAACGACGWPTLNTLLCPCAVAVWRCCRGRLEILVQNPPDGQELYWHNTRTIPKPYKGPQEVRFEQDFPPDHDIKLALTRCVCVCACVR